jgi:hypothetical protein
MDQPNKTATPVEEYAMKVDLPNATYTEPGTRGVACLADGSELVVTEGGGPLTDEATEYMLDLITGLAERSPIVSYVGPRIYMS